MRAARLSPSSGNRVPIGSMGPCAAPAGDRRRCAVAEEDVQYRKVGIEEQPDRLSDGREDLAGGRLLRDEYRHPAQRRLLLGQRAANGHIPRDAVEDAQLRQRARVPLEPANRAVGADEAALESDGVLAGGQMDERVASALHVIRMHELQERPRHELLARVAQHALERRVQPLEVAVEAGDAEQVGREIEELAQLVIRRGHRHTASMTIPLRSTPSAAVACRTQPA